jgi:hypothetical protein
MGLDMFLSKKHYVKNWNHMKPEELHKIAVKKNNKVVPHINPKKITYIVEEVAYWRKANAIHDWFVQNCQEGIDDCKEYWVTKLQLQELYDACVLVRDNCQLTEGKVKNGYGFNEDGEKEQFIEDGKIIKDPSVAENLLPTSEGFFFGGTDYDQYYMEDINNTIEMLGAELAINYGEKALDEPEYFYRASW